MNYQVVQESLWTREIGRYTSYGVCAWHMEGERRVVLAHISDVFLNEETALNFVDRCNRLKLDLIHLSDAIEDALNDDGGAPGDGGGKR